MARMLWRWSLVIASPAVFLYSACTGELSGDGPWLFDGGRGGTLTDPDGEELGGSEQSWTNGSDGTGGDKGAAGAGAAGTGGADGEGGAGGGAGDDTLGEGGVSQAGHAGTGGAAGASGVGVGAGGSNASGGRGGVAAGGANGAAGAGGAVAGAGGRPGSGGASGRGGADSATGGRFGRPDGGSGRGGGGSMGLGGAGTGGAATGGAQGKGGAMTDGGGDIADVQFCIDENNRYRATLGLPALKHNTSIDAFAAAGAEYDYAAKTAHKHFGDMKGVSGSWGSGENEIPGFSGWSIKRQGSVHNIIQQGISGMWDEGPGGGHYDNMVSTSYTDIGCGVYEAPNGDVTVTIDFAKF